MENNEPLYQAILGSAGTGKLAPNTEPVLTPRGYIPMGEVKEGTLVISGDGSVTEVLQVYPQTNLRIYKLYFSDGTFTECCEDHLWKVQTKDLKSLGKFKVLPLKEMLSKINNRKTKKEGHYYSIPLCGSVQFFPQTVELHPYLLGYLIGNGYTPQKGTVVITTHKADAAEIYSYITAQVPQDVTTSLSNAAYLEEGNVGKIGLSSTIKPYLQSLGLLDVKSREKFIPAAYKYNSVYIRKQILAGLLDSDGSITLKQLKDGGTKRTSFSTTSSDLAKDVIFLVRSLGGVATYATYNRKRTGRDEIQVVFRLPENPFILRQKASLFDSINTFWSWTKQIVDVEYVGQKDGQCIVVQHPDHTYLTRDFIVTHNSYSINENLKIDPNYCLRTSTTGISAINMGSANGSTMATTINSALGFFDTASLLHKYIDKSIQKPLEKIGDRYSYIAIDEVGMCEAPMLDIIYLALEEYNDTAKRNLELGRTHNTNPLGLIVLGDSAQLPPVSNKPFFEAKYWDKFSVTYLTKVYRQEDADFVEALRAVRLGEAERIVDWFESNVGFHSRVDKKYRGSTFFTTHKQVNGFNARELDELPGESTTYYRSISGKAAPVWKDIPESVELKVGALVCLNVNNFNAGYANGDMGYIEGLYSTQVLVRLIRNNLCVYIERCTIEHIPPGEEKPIGRIRFMPVRLAWARTIHSCQSQTVDAIQCRLGGNFMPKCSGMLYTALSRVRTKEGLRLVGTRKDFIESTYVEPKYLKYIR